MDAYMIGALIGSLISGSIVGAIPAISGGVKGKLGLGIGGFFACLLSSIILGLILSVPVCAVFMFLIFKKDKTDSTGGDKFISSPGVYCSKCGKEIEENDNFCKNCGNPRQ